jgi:hypothetical protein
MMLGLGLRLGATGTGTPASGGGAPPASLTVVSGATFIYSAVKVVGYSGPYAAVIDGASAAHDVPFDAATGRPDLNYIASLTQPVTVVGRYDQSGNGNHEVQNTAGNRPKLINGNNAQGAVIFGGRTYGTAAFYPLTNIPDTVALNRQGMSVFSVMGPQVTNQTTYLYAFGRTTSDIDVQLGGQVQKIRVATPGGADYSPPLPSINPQVLGLTLGAASSTCYRNATSHTVSNPAAVAMTGGMIGSNASFGATTPGLIEKLFPRGLAIAAKFGQCDHHAHGAYRGVQHQHGPN